MCGISGFIDSSLSNEQAEKTIGSMLESIAHRGPDARSNERGWRTVEALRRRRSTGRRQRRRVSSDTS